MDGCPLLVLHVRLQLATAALVEVLEKIFGLLNDCFSQTHYLHISESAAKIDIQVALSIIMKQEHMFRRMISTAESPACPQACPLCQQT
jgi:hypothetical protein